MDNCLQLSDGDGLSRTDAPSAAADITWGAFNRLENLPQKAKRGAKMSKWDKVDYVLEKLGKIRWSAADFCEAYTTLKPDSMHPSKASTRARKVAMRLLNNSSSKENLEVAATRKDKGWLTIPALQAELDELRRSSRFFGEFDPEMDLSELDLTQISTDIKGKAPTLHNLLSELTVNRRETNTREDSFSDGRITALCFILSYSRARNSSNMFPTMLGVYFHGSGVKRRVLELLGGLGISCSYTTI